MEHLSVGINSPDQVNISNIMLWPVFFPQKIIGGDEGRQKSHVRKILWDCTVKTKQGTSDGIILRSISSLVLSELLFA